MEREKPSIVQVLKFYGADEHRLPGAGYGWRPCLCPFHEDTHPSASVNTTLEAFRCHTCGVAGDSWKLIMEREGVKFAEAIRFAETNFNHESGSVSGAAGKRRPYSPSWS